MVRGMPFLYPFLARQPPRSLVCWLAQTHGARIVPLLYGDDTAGLSGFLFAGFGSVFRSGNLAEDVARQNTFIEAQVEALRDQYFWLHKRFKTRPDGRLRFTSR